MLFGLPGFVQEAAIAALGVAAAAEARAREYCAARQRRFAAGIAGIEQLRAATPEAGMFMLLDVVASGLTGGEFMRALYDARRVSVMDGAAFGAATAGCVRICFAADEVMLDAACDRLRRFCAQDLPALAGAAKRA